MADDKGKRGARDRATVSGSETYELNYFAKKHGLTEVDAQAIIDRVGNSRAALDAAVSKKSTVGRPRSSSKPANAGANTAKRRRAAPAKSTRVSALPIKKSSVAATPLKGADAVVERGAAPLVDAARAIRRTVTKGADRAASGARAAASGRAAIVVGAATAGLVTGLAINLGRKVMVQAPSALAGDWFDAVKLEHKLALALFDQLQATAATDAAKRTVLLTQLTHALSKHAFMEENVLYPALRAWGDKADADKLSHDHGYVKQNLYDLEAMDNAAPSFLDKVATFRADVEAHIREEEDAIFPPLHAALGESGNATVTAQANKESFKLA